MRIIDCLLVLPLLLLASKAAHAQDELYLPKDVKKGKITEISPVAVKYQNQSNAAGYLVSNDKILFLINSRGDFLLPSQINKDSIYSRQRIAHFIAADTSYARGDQLFLSPDTRIEGVISKEDNNFFYLSDTGKVDKKNLVAVIYSNGAHKFYGPADKVAAVLEHFLHPPVYPAPTPVSAPSSLAAGTGNMAETGAAGSSDPPAPATVLKVSPASNDSAAAVIFAKLAPNVNKREFEEKATKKTEKLTEYLKILCDKTAPAEACNKAIDQAVTLFVNEEAKIMVSSLKSNTIPQYKIRNYLMRLKLVKYDRIEVEWTNVQYVSDLRKGDDGNFYGLVQFEQKFSGYKDGKLVYQDITVKRAEVILKTYEKSVEGTTQTLWDVLLGNVGVKSIQSL